MKNTTEHPEWVKVYWLEFQQQSDPVFEKGDLSHKPSKLLEQESLEIINIAQIVDDLKNKKNDFQVINPSNEQHYATISLGKKEDVDIGQGIKVF